MTSNNETDRILPTTGHTRYQSIGPTEPEEQEVTIALLVNCLLNIKH
jgi:hypothetical protein